MLLFMPSKAESTAKNTHLITLEGGWAGFHQESFDAHKAEILLELDKNHKSFVILKCFQWLLWIWKAFWFTTWWLCFCWSETGLKVEWCQKPPRVGMSDSPDLKTSKWLQNTYETVPKAYTLQAFIIHAVSSNSISLKGNAWRSESAFSSALQQMKLARHLPCPCCVGVSQSCFGSWFPLGSNRVAASCEKGYQICWIHLNPEPEAIYLRNDYL